MFDCWLVGLSAGLYKNCLMDFDVTWMEDGFCPRIGPINFWCRSGKGDGSRNSFSLSLTLQDGAFLYIFTNFSGTNEWILMKKKNQSNPMLVTMFLVFCRQSGLVGLDGGMHSSVCHCSFIWIHLFISFKIMNLTFKELEEQSS